MDTTNGWRKGSLTVLNTARNTFVPVRHSYYHRNYMRPDSSEFPIWAVQDTESNYWVLVPHAPVKRLHGWEQVNATSMDEAKALALVMERMQ